MSGALSRVPERGIGALLSVLFTVRDFPKGNIICRGYYTKAGLCGQISLENATVNKQKQVCV